MRKYLSRAAIMALLEPCFDQEIRVHVREIGPNPSEYTRVVELRGVVFNEKTDYLEVFDKNDAEDNRIPLEWVKSIDRIVTIHELVYSEKRAEMMKEDSQKAMSILDRAVPSVSRETSVKLGEMSEAEAQRIADGITGKGEQDV